MFVAEPDFIDKLIAELYEARKSNWHQDGYKPFIFKTFLLSPCGTNGVPTTSSDNVVSLVRNRLGRESPKYTEVEEVLFLVAAAWDEWRYALNHFHRAE